MWRKPILQSLPMLLGTVIAWHGAPLQCAASQPATDLRNGLGEAEFLRQLLARGLYDLAETYCERQLALAATPDDRALWELALADCFRQHAWALTTANRNSLLHHAVERITSFTSAQTVAPAAELMLRLQQMELLVEGARMQLLIDSAGRWFVPEGGQSSPTMTEGLRRGNDGTQAAQHDAAVRKAAELAQALLDQIEQIRRDLDPAVVQLLRERARSVLCECGLWQAQTANSSEAQQAALQQTARILQPLLRSVSDPEQRLRLMLLAAEMELLRGDLAAFDLKLSAAANAAPAAHQRAVLAWQVRGLLRRGQPSAALQQLVTWQRDKEALNQELTCLKLESLLGMYALVATLDDAAVMQSTAEEMERQLQQSATLTAGVWRESCDRVAARFRRIQQAGLVAADQLEQVERLTAAGDLEAAQQLLTDILRQPAAVLPATARGALQLQHGELCLRLQNWSAAQTSLQQAAVQLQQQNSPLAAAADLLRVYAVGRNWESGPHRAARDGDYEQALREHLQKYPQAATRSTARKWLIRLLTSTDKALAADQWLLLAEQEAADAERPNWLIAAGELLLGLQADATAAPSATPGQPADALETTADPRSSRTAGADSGILQGSAASKYAVTEPEPNQLFTVLRERWNAQISPLIQAPDAAPPHDTDTAAAAVSATGPHQRGTLRLQQAELTLSALHSPQPDDWSRLRAQLDVALTELQSPESIAPASPPTLAQAPANQPALRDVMTPPAAPAALAADDALPLPKLPVLRQRCQLLLLVATVRTSLDSAAAAKLADPLQQLAGTERLAAVRFLHRQYAGIPETGGDLLLARTVQQLLPDCLATVQSVPLRIDLLEAATAAASRTGDAALQQQLLDELLRGPLTDSELLLVAEILSRWPTRSDSADTQPAVAQRFWQNVLKRTRQGSSPWLEASLQTALLHERRGELTAALRILNVVEVLYPDWGSSHRHDQAQQLRQRLQDAPR